MTTVYLVVAGLAALTQTRTVNRCIEAATDDSRPPRERRAAANRIGTVTIDALVWPLTAVLALVALAYAAIIVRSASQVARNKTASGAGARS